MVVVDVDGVAGTSGELSLGRGERTAAIPPMDQAVADQRLQGKSEE